MSQGGHAVGDPVAPMPADLLGVPHGLGAGHGACPGCSATAVIRIALHVARVALHRVPVVVGGGGCLDRATCAYPVNAWRVPFIASPPADGPAAAAGLAAALRARRARGELDGETGIKLLVLADSMTTRRWGLCGMRLAIRRGTDLTYICNVNEPPEAAWFGGAGRSPVRCAAPSTPPQDYARLAAAEEPAYAAQASIHAYEDLAAKLLRAMDACGPAFVSVLAPCAEAADPVVPCGQLALAEAAVECNLWPLYEWECGRGRLTYRPLHPVPVADYLARTRRGTRTAEAAAGLQEAVDRGWQRLCAELGSEGGSDRGEGSGVRTGNYGPPAYDGDLMGPRSVTR